MKMMNANKAKIKGMTLVEILITIAIIGLLALIAIPNYMRNRAIADKASMEQTMRQVAQKMEQIFWGQNPNEYPPPSAMANGLVTWAAPTNLGNINDLTELLKKLCQQIGTTSMSSTAAQAATASDPALTNFIEQCMSHGSYPLIYVTTAGYQDYFFAAGNSKIGGYFAGGNGGVGFVPGPLIPTNPDDTDLVPIPLPGGGGGGGGGGCGGGYGPFVPSGSGSGGAIIHSGAFFGPDVSTQSTICAPCAPNECSQAATQSDGGGSGAIVAPTG